MFMIVIRCIFIFKYYKKGTDAYSYLRSVIYLSDADVDGLFNSKRKSNCTPCQYCCFLACFNCMGAMVPPTPSPYSSPNLSPSKWRKSVKTPTSSTTLTERQYHSLYRDFKHASQIELRDQTSRGVRIYNQLDGPVEEEMREIIHPFLSGIFTTLVEDYLKLFEEMVKGLILLKETGITLEDICSIGEERHNYYCQRATSTFKNNSKLSFCRPYNAEEFEKLLQDELKNKFQSLRDMPKCSHKLHQESDRNACSGRESQICDCEQGTMGNNPYLTFLTEINCHSPHTFNTEEFDQILRIDKKTFLKNCLKLLRENEYFGFHSKSSSVFFCAAIDDCNSSSPQQDIDNAEMYNMSVGIYNQTICNVQSAILAIFRSMEYGEQDRKILLPPTSDKTSDMEITLKINESKNLIKKSLSQYFKPVDLSALSEDNVFIPEPLNRDSTVQDGGTSVKYLQYNKPDEDFQAIPSVKYEDGESLSGPFKSRPYNSLYEPYSKKRFPPPRLEITQQQHPDLEYPEDSMNQTCKGHGMNHLSIQNKQENVAKTDFSQDVGKTSNLPNKRRDNKATAGCLLEKIKENVEQTGLPPQTTKASLLNKLLFKKKKNDVCVMCVFNYSEPEVSHVVAIAFLKKMEAEGGTFHYPHCSENTLLTKILGPSFYFSVCCAICRQELAPPEKLEAFKSKPETNRSKIISYMIRKSRASFYFPVQCGSCGYFLCDPQKTTKHLYVPFHSPVKSYICASRLRSHECQVSSSNTEYTGCISDTTNDSCTHGQKISEKELKRGKSYDYLKSPNFKYLARSRSLPVLLRRDHNIIINVNQNKSRHSARRNEFEDAITNILNMWTYEMIDYEKGANSPEIRSQIMNYRKSRSICIKKDIIEKLHCRHVLSVFKRIEDYESPILEVQGYSGQTSTMLGKIMRRSRSCHSKLKYETTSTTHRSKSESLVCEDFSTQINTFKQTLSEIEKDAKRPQSFYRKNIASSFYSEHKPIAFSRHFKSESLEYNNIVSTLKNTRKHTLLDPEIGKGSLYLRSETLNRQNIARPISLHSELKQKTPKTHRRRSCSFTEESVSKDDFITEINAWKDKLLHLQKSVESPHFRSETPSHNNRTRPFSLHSDLQQKTLDTHRRRRSSCSFTTDSEHKDIFSTQINAWKHEMLKLQKIVQNPHLESETLHRKNMARPISLDSNLKQKTSHNRRRSYSFASAALYRDDFSIQIDEWKNELQEIQKSVESPHLRPEIMKRIHKASAGAGSSHLETNQRTSAVTSCQSELDDSVSELKAWNHRLRELEKDATRPYLRSETLKHKIKTRAVSLYTEPKHTTTASRNRPKSESVLHDYTSELNTWKHELQKLEDGSKNPQLQSEALMRKNITISHSFNSEQKYQPVVAHRVNFRYLNNRGDTTRRHTWMAPMHRPLEPNVQARTNVPQYNPPVRRYSTTPRQLPAIPNHRNIRRHSHYETTGNFLNLLSSDRKATRLNANTPNPAVSSYYGCANQGSIHPQETSDGFLGPYHDEGPARPT